MQSLFQLESSTGRGALRAGPTQISAPPLFACERTRRLATYIASQSRLHLLLRPRGWKCNVKYAQAQNSAGCGGGCTTLPTQLYGPSASLRWKDDQVLEASLPRPLPAGLRLSTLLHQGC